MTSTSLRTIVGAGWLIASRLLTRSIDLVGLLVLARILAPADFGIVAISMTLVQLVEAVLELPVGQVLVRADDLTEPLLSTAFTLGLIRSVALALVLVLLSGPFASIYHDQRLIALICFLSLAPALRGLISPRMVVFARAIDFRREVALEVSSKVAALVLAASAAYLSHSYWAIALGTVASPAVLVLGSYVLAPSRPRVCLSEWRVFAAFLGWTTAAQVVTAINWQSDRPILGLFVSPSLLGTFSVANDLSLLPEQALVKPIYRPLLSGFATVLEDAGRLRGAYLRASRLIVSVGVPVMIMTALLAEPATRLALGPKWTAAAPIVQWLALGLIIPLFSAPMAPLAVAVGKTHVFFRQNCVELVLRIPIATFLTWKLGVPGLVGARLLTSLINTSTAIYYVKVLTGLRFINQLAVGWRPIASGGAMALLLVLTRHYLQSKDHLLLFIGIIASAVGALTAYVVVHASLWIVSGRPEGAEQAIAGWMVARGKSRGVSQGGRSLGS